MATQSEDPNERVNHPRHYTQHPSGIECIDVIEHLPCNLANAVKYVWRCGLKASETSLRDLSSARWYVDREMRRIELYDVDEDAEQRTDVVWLALARRVIEKDGSTVLGVFLSSLLDGTYDDLFFILDKEIKRLEGASKKPRSTPSRGEGSGIHKK